MPVSVTGAGWAKKRTSKCITTGADAEFIAACRLWETFSIFTDLERK